MCGLRRLRHVLAAGADDRSTAGRGWTHAGAARTGPNSSAEHERQRLALGAGDARDAPRPTFARHRPELAPRIAAPGVCWAATGSLSTSPIDCGRWSGDIQRDQHGGRHRVLDGLHHLRGRNQVDPTLDQHSPYGVPMVNQLAYVVRPERAASPSRSVLPGELYLGGDRRRRGVTSLAPPSVPRSFVAQPLRRAGKGDRGCTAPEIWPVGCRRRCARAVGPHRQSDQDSWTIASSSARSSRGCSRSTPACEEGVVVAQVSERGRRQTAGGVRRPGPGVDRPRRGLGGRRLGTDSRSSEWEVGLRQRPTPLEAGDEDAGGPDLQHRRLELAATPTRLPIPPEADARMGRPPPSSGSRATAAGRRVLEIGCGSGPDALSASRRTAHSYVGTDSVQAVATRLPSAASSPAARPRAMSSSDHQIGRRLHRDSTTQSFDAMVILNSIILELFPSIELSAAGASRGRHAR